MPKISIYNFSRAMKTNSIRSLYTFTEHEEYAKHTQLLWQLLLQERRPELPFWKSTGQNQKCMSIILITTEDEPGTKSRMLTNLHNARNA